MEGLDVGLEVGGACIGFRWHIMMFSFVQKGANTFENRWMRVHPLLEMESHWPVAQL